MSRVTIVAVLADGQRMLSVSEDGTLQLWDLGTGAELRRLEGHKDAIIGVAVLADGRRAVSGSADRTLRLWNLETACLSFDAKLSALAWSDRVEAALVGDSMGMIHVIELLNKRTAATI